MQRDARVDRWPMLAGIGLALYMTCLMITAPASLMAWAIALESHGVVLLEGTRGALWRGSASNLAVSSAAAGPQRFGELTWNVAVLRLLGGQLAIEIAIDGAAKASGTVVLQRRSIGLLHSRLALSAPAAVPFVPVLQLVQPGGQISVQADNIAFSGNAVTGKAVAVWSDASSALSTVKPLGTYRATFEGNDGPARFDVTTVEGSLQVSGRGSWAPLKSASFDGVARARPDAAPRLGDLLRLLGPDTGDGSHQLRYAATPGA